MGLCRAEFKDVERAEVFQQKPSKPLYLMCFLQCYESANFFSKFLISTLGKKNVAFEHKLAVPVEI